MDWAGGLIGLGALVVREATLFAAAGFILLGIGDLVVDLIWLALRVRRAVSRTPPASVGSLPAPERPGRLAVFVPATLASDF